MKFKEYLSENKTDEVPVNIDANAIEKTINDYIKKTHGVNPKIKIKTKSGKLLFEQTENLAKTMTPKMFKTLNITVWGKPQYNSVISGFQLNLHWKYEHHDGGSNGFQIGFLIINADGIIKN